MAYIKTQRYKFPTVHGSNISHKMLKTTGSIEGSSIQLYFIYIVEQNKRQRKQYTVLSGMDNS